MKLNFLIYYKNMDVKIKISGIGFDGSKILLSRFGSRYSGYPIFVADPERIWIPDNNLMSNCGDIYENA